MPKFKGIAPVANKWNISRGLCFFLFVTQIFAHVPTVEPVFTLFDSQDISPRWLHPQRDKTAKVSVFHISSQNTRKSDVNRHFQAKLAWHWNSHLQNYIADSNQISHNDKNHQPIFASGLNRRKTNPRWGRPPFYDFKHLQIAVSPHRFKLLQRNLAGWSYP